MCKNVLYEKEKWLMAVCMRMEDGGIRREDEQAVCKGGRYWDDGRVGG